MLEIDNLFINIFRTYIANILLPILENMLKPFMMKKDSKRGKKSVFVSLFEISFSTISWHNGQEKVKCLWPKGKILLNFENEKKKIVKNQRIKGKNQKKNS